MYETCNGLKHLLQSDINTFDVLVSTCSDHRYRKKTRYILRYRKCDVSVGNL